MGTLRNNHEIANDSIILGLFLHSATSFQAFVSHLDEHSDL